MSRMNLLDAQVALGFAQQAFYNIETGIYETRYPDYDYASLIPVETSGNEWARGTMFYSTDSVGEATFLAGQGFDMPYADFNKTQFLTAHHLAGIGYEWNLEELQVAAMEGVPVSDMKAKAAKRAAEIMLFNIALTGSTEKNWTGLFNNASVTAGNVAASGTAGGLLWTTKTGDLQLADLNAPISGIFTGSLEAEMADTLILPTSALLTLGTTYRSTSTDRTLLDHIRENNVYSQQTGQPLMIRASRKLETAGAGGTRRMVAYRRSPEVVKFHLPMPHKFLPPFQKGSMTYEVAGIMRTGGTEIRLPSAIRYADGF